eukprot:TRINITY_DN27816_c0_g1_i1.p1 TRINITY_DN27816_c0_g1~~TRINITY_DN27816_c0_g1_i1.p1  ORF type:complete len:144 (+),score=19.54 TRINITY_DN27816_c0_g1_i1:70-501(+)
MIAPSARKRMQACVSLVVMSVTTSFSVAAADGMLLFQNMRAQLKETQPTSMPPPSAAPLPPSPPPERADVPPILQAPPLPELPQMPGLDPASSPPLPPPPPPRATVPINLAPTASLLSAPSLGMPNRISTRRPRFRGALALVP